MTIQEAQKQISGNWLKYYQMSLGQSDNKQKSNSKKPDYVLIVSLISVATAGSYVVYRLKKKK